MQLGNETDKSQIPFPYSTANNQRIKWSKKLAERHEKRLREWFDNCTPEQLSYMYQLCRETIDLGNGQSADNVTWPLLSSSIIKDAASIVVKVQMSNGSRFDYPVRSK